MTSLRELHRELPAAPSASTLISCGNQRYVHLGIVIVCALITRIAYLYSPAGRIGDGDEAIFGLMAQQIASLAEFPIYCWGAQYAGAFVSYAAAPLFVLFGSSFVVLRLPMLLMATIASSLYYLFLERLAGPTLALVGSLVLAVAPMIVVHYTMAAYGGYGETILGITLLLFLAQRAEADSKDGRTGAWPWLLGLTSGFFFYTLFLILPAILAFAVPPLLAVAANRRRRIFEFLTGTLVGLSPLIIHNILEPGGTIFRAVGRSLSVGRTDLQTPYGELVWHVVIQKATYWYDWLLAAPRLFGEFVVSGRGADHIGPMAGAALIVFLLVFGIRSLARSQGLTPETLQYRRCALFLVFLIGFQWIANLDRARHLLPLILVIPVAAFALANSRRAWQRSAVAGLLLFVAVQVPGLLLGFQRKGFDPAPTVSHLETIGVREFYGSYHTTYPIAFVAADRFVGAPLLPPGTRLVVDRRPQYTQRVTESPSPAFIFARNEAMAEELFRTFLRDNHISFRRSADESAAVYFGFSRRVAMEVSPDGTRFVLRER